MLLKFGIFLVYLTGSVLFLLAWGWVLFGTDITIHGMKVL